MSIEMEMAMAALEGSPLAVPKFVGLRACDMHSAAIVTFQGRACPLCLALDEAEDARKYVEDLRRELSYLESKGE